MHDSGGVIEAGYIIRGEIEISKAMKEIAASCFSFHGPAVDVVDMIDWGQDNCS